MAVNIFKWHKLILRFNLVYPSLFILKSICSKDGHRQHIMLNLKTVNIVCVDQMAPDRTEQ